MGPTKSVIGICVLLAAGCSPPAAPPPSPPGTATTSSEVGVLPSTKYYQSLGETSHPDWMRWIPDGTSLGRVSLPGTHDSLSIHGGDLTETQENYGDHGATLAAQLNAGIRAIDVRVHVLGTDLSWEGSPDDDMIFTIHHGAIYQEAYFGDVLRVVGDFLAAHPTETVVMRLKAECTGDLGSCTDAKSVDNDDITHVFRNYRDYNPYAQRYFWTPSVIGPEDGAGGGANMPTIGEVRGKIVLRSFDGRKGGWFHYGLWQVADESIRSTYIQDDSDVANIGHITEKWNKVQAHLAATNADSNKDNMYVNFLSGSSLTAYPYTVAGGSPGITGVNRHCIDYLLGSNVERTGVLMMDLPGAGLIDAIIAHNYALAPWSPDVEADAYQMYQNIVYQPTGDANDRASVLDAFLQHVAPQLYWNVGVVKRDYGYSIVASPNHVVMDNVVYNDYRFLLYASDQTGADQTTAEIQSVVDPALGGLSGDALSRANALSAALQGSYPGTRWSVIVKADPGGFENWTVIHYGATYQTHGDGYGYLVYGIGPGSNEDVIAATDWNVSLSEAGTPGERVAYFTSWSIYANALYLKTLDSNGTAGKLTKLNYAFENIDPASLTCFAANQSSSGDESSPDGNDGASDAWADYQRGFTAEESVDGVADSWGDPLKGNFNQLKKLKARYPNLKTVVTIGGWTFSKYFSDVAATDASRKKFVRSCIDMYIRGNLPQIGDDPAGGDGVAAGVFDGIDIDWEFPGSPDGHTGNHDSAQDAANFTLLLAEFRTELDALGGHYLLTAALPSGSTNIAQIQLPGVASYLDLGHIMTYDMHGAWETSGPTNFQAPTFASPQDPSTTPGLSIDAAITAYVGGGFPASKITLGVPFYARGWQGVPDSGRHGLYQPTGPATDPYAFSQQPGVAFYKELVADGKLTNTTVFWDPVVKSTWVYDGNNFFSVETPKSLSAKRQYIRDHGLAGVMMYSLEADDPSTTLLDAATNLP